MAERIIIFLCVFFCGVPFLGIALLKRTEGQRPIGFWTGSEEKLKTRIQDIPAYNARMAALYGWYGLALMLSAMTALFYPWAGLVIFGGEVTIGLYWVYREYKKTLDEYSQPENLRQSG